MQTEGSEQQHVHFVGIAGIGMSAIAHVLLDRGVSVSGSDVADGWALSQLIKDGARCCIGHDPAHFGDADLLVYSPAVPPDNCELEAARKRDIPVISRAWMLNRLAQEFDCIGISGSHGKSTTSWLVGDLLIQAKLDPTVLVGAKVESLGGNSRTGKSRFLVAEVDESDGVFADMEPALAVVTNTDLEHVDHYRSLEDLQSHFRRFIQNSAFGLGAVVCADCPATMAAAAGTNVPLLTYGIHDGDLRASKILVTPSGCHFEAEWRGKRLGEFWTPLLGKHNVRNVLAAIGVGLKLDLPIGKIARSIAKNHGVDRRLSHRATVNGVSIWDDYGHHPTEIRATLNALRSAVEGRIIIVFQPHRYSRTSFFHREFGKAIARADHAIVTSIYAASEKPIEGVDSRLIVEEAQKHCRGKVELIAEKEFVPDRLAQVVQPGDAVLFQGAGDVYQLSKRLTTLLATPQLTMSGRSVG